MSPSTDAASPAPIDGAPAHPHNFEVQKEIHRSIRNDPDYDDWEYGTEPLPHEAWVRKGGQGFDPAQSAAG
ncbi:hypothetical protein NZK33_12665 [Cyanobium sp. FGCU-6]|jgi:hypothetical protein|nr:hypothetical protein [Cyanobium sp. FGCU6]